MNTTTGASPYPSPVAASRPLSSLNPASEAGVRVAAGDPEREQPAVSWAAIICGAVVASAISLVLIALGTGLNLASVSPWAGIGVTSTTFTAMTAIWFIVIQWVASGLGGYLSGRLRTKWVGVHTHEVFFRDTAHGFATWALASLVVAFALSTTIASILSGGGRLAALAGATTADSRSVGTLSSYALDLLLRGSTSNSTSQPDLRPEALRMVSYGLTREEGVPSTDRTYLAAQVAARTGVSQGEAQQRVDAFIASAKETADQTRKATAAAAVFTAVSMLIGAFIACVAAALGGLRRDAPVPVVA